MQEKHIPANNAPFMNKTLHKAVMTRARITFNNVTYKKYRNNCVNLLRREVRKYYENLDLTK